MLRSGALPASLTYLEERTIGPTLGADSIRSGVIASLHRASRWSSSFMLVYYRLSGVNAIVALVFNLIILLGAMAYIGATMTLPGIAGFVLTMGMGVDSNVLIFERIKEELAAQRGVRASINAGFSRVFLTLVDTHLSALIGAAFLFQFGTGPIRGFATTLFFGLVSNLFTSTFVSKTLFEMVLAKRQVETLEHLAMQIFHNPNFNFVKYRWPALILSWVIIAAGLATIYVKGIPLGVEFSGGTIVIAAVRPDARASTRCAPPSAAVSAAVRTWSCRPTAPRRTGAIMVRVPQVGREAGAELSQPAEEIERAVRAANLGKFKVVSTEIVGPDRRAGPDAQGTARPSASRCSSSCSTSGSASS